MKCPKCSRELLMYIKNVGWKEPNDLNHWQENHEYLSFPKKCINGKYYAVKNCYICGGEIEEPKE